MDKEKAAKAVARKAADERLKLLETELKERGFCVYYDGSRLSVMR